MTVDERGRKALYQALERRIGPEAAATMMELLPPVGWADVATKEDLRQLELRLLAELRAEMAELRAETRTMGVALSREIGESARSQLRTFMVTNASMVLAVAGLAFGAARLA